MAAVGVSPAHTSEPRDAVLALDGRAAAHLVAVHPAAAAHELLAAWVAGGRRVPLVQVDADGGEDALVAGVAAHLATAVVGVRLYAGGSEGLVRRLVRAGHAAGLADDEIVAAVTAGRARPVWCVHCGAVTPAVTATTAPCDGCGRMLVAYHHFSRRLGAYLGYQVDAEVPGDRPEPEPVWS